MSVIAITQIIESAINVTLTALQGKVQRVVNTGASSITVTLGSGGSTVSVATGAFVDCWYSGTTWYSFLNSTDNVKTAGAQTIADVKTFSSIPVLPASNPTTDNQAVRKKYVDEYFMKYDYIVNSQAKFDALVASGTWLGAKNVLFTTNVTRAAQTTIPATVEKIHTINGAVLTVTGLTTGQYGIGYATRPTDLKFEVKGLNVSASGTGVIYAFKNCTQLTSCTGTGASSNGDGIGFTNCTQLTSCTGTGTGTNNGIGFTNCTQLTSCTGTGTGGTYGIGFNGCAQLTICAGVGTGSTSGCGYINCAYAGFCRKSASSTTSTWGGSNIKIRGCEDVADDA